MKIVVAGAGGAIGGYLVPRLVAEGHQVVGLTRAPSGAVRVRELGAEPVVADLLDADGLLTAVRGLRADAVIHQATALDRVPMLHRHLYPTNALRDQGTRNLLRAATELGAGRFLTQSFFLGYGYRDHGSGLVTEEQPFAQASGTAFDVHLRSMHANETSVFTAPGIEGIALRYGLFYGKDAATDELVRRLRARGLPVPHPGAITSLIHLDDAAAATVAALHHGRPGHAYNIVDDEPTSFADYLRELAATHDAPPPREVPGWLLRPLPYPYAVLVGTRLRVSNALAKTHLAWTPKYPSHREGLRARER
ncbi:NAD-dependent epimerase/dehydratase family protein [Pseudonocardia spinosispora]|uniref:NAD-dependent epimerase/dehydratase family protein n=1 Tax=Pseudonocardia spinosispora TaxID=103441 RepID=UPI000411B008|nr:NAD-dependent epimerase/dehydratase family protein [Pseudonocardia spinosispora]